VAGGGVRTTARSRRRQRFGRRIRDLRTEQGHSQETLAEVAGLHRNYIGGIERGERNVGLDNIFILADALGVTAAELFSDE
jgi:transcriptional regulator with XRE-family HTH domain